MQTVSKATKAAIIVVREAGKTVNNAISMHVMPRSDGPVLTQLKFGWRVDKYQELSNFKVEEKNIFMTNIYNTQESERVPIILNWLGWKGPSPCIWNGNDQEK